MIRPNKPRDDLILSYLDLRYLILSLILSLLSVFWSRSSAGNVWDETLEIVLKQTTALEGALDGSPHSAAAVRGALHTAAASDDMPSCRRPAQQRSWTP